MTKPVDPALSRLALLQKRVAFITWIIVTLLSLRGLFVFYGMKEKGSLEQIITFITEPMVQLFKITGIDNINLPAASVFMSLITVLLFSNIFQTVIRRTDARLVKAHLYLLRHAAYSK